MKKLPGNVAVIAGFVCLAPVVALAQNIVSQTGVVNRSVERLTLLPGPNLLSPGRTTPTMSPSPIKLEDIPRFQFVPQFRAGGNRAPETAAPVEATPPQSKPYRLPAPELLRFDQTLKIAPAPSKQ